MTAVTTMVDGVEKRNSFRSWGTIRIEGGGRMAVEPDLIARAKVGDDDAKRENAKRENAKREIVKECQPIVEGLVSVCLKELVRQGLFTQADLTSRGNEGIITAIERFNSAKGKKFENYADSCVRASLLQFLIEEYHKGTSLIVEDAVVKLCEPIADERANHHIEKFGYLRHDLEKKDLIQEGNLGILRALKKSDPTKGITFQKYAWFWAWSFIQEMFFPAAVRKKLSKIYKAIDKISSSKRMIISIFDLSETIISAVLNSGFFYLPWNLKKIRDKPINENRREPDIYEIAQETGIPRNEIASLQGHYGIRISIPENYVPEDDDQNVSDHKIEEKLRMIIIEAVIHSFDDPTDKLIIIKHRECHKHQEKELWFLFIGDETIVDIAERMIDRKAKSGNPADDLRKTAAVLRKRKERLIKKYRKHIDESGTPGHKCEFCSFEEYIEKRYASIDN